MPDLRRLSRGAAAAVVIGSTAAACCALSALADTGAGTAPVVVSLADAPQVHVQPRLVEPVAGVAGAHRPAATRAGHRHRARVVRPATASPALSGSLAHAIGAKVMTGMDGTYPSRALLSRVRKGEIGGVILMGANVSPQLPAAIAALQHAAARADDPPLVIATDQEGGEVRRLPNAPPVEPPATMGGNIEHQGRITARALLAERINTDLAPVADVLHRGSFIGSRSFGSNPAKVAGKACQFAIGLQSAGVNATFKHFPGLGDAITNTDLQATTVAASKATLLADLLPYRSCQPRLVMVSNADYPALGSDGPAVFSAAVVTTLLRRQLGFRGVTISDTLGAPEVAGPGAVVRASKAGVDMLLYTDESGAASAYNELIKAVEKHTLSQSAVRASAARIYALAESPGG
jgi:beta-N-acetylhexosaminidase